MVQPAVYTAISQPVKIAAVVICALSFISPPAWAAAGDFKRDAQMTRDQGLALQNQGDLEGALKMYEKASMLDPNNPVIYNDMGIVYEAKGLMKQAEQQYLKAVQIDPQFANSYSNLALLSEEQRDFEKAGMYWQKRAQIGDQNDPWKAKAKEKLYDLGASAPSFRQDTSKMSETQKQSRFYRNEGLKLQKLGNVDGALSLYRKALQLDPSYAVVYNDTGVIMEAKGMAKEAEQNYIKAADLDPHFAGAYSNLALLYEGQRRLEKARAAWQKRKALGRDGDPWRDMAQRRIHDIDLALGIDSPGKLSKEQEVMDLVKDVASDRRQLDLQKENQKQSLVNFEAAKVQYRKGNYPVAFRRALDAYQLDPRNAEIVKFLDHLEIRALSQ